MKKGRPENPDKPYKAVGTKELTDGVIQAAYTKIYDKYIDGWSTEKIFTWAVENELLPSISLSTVRYHIREVRKSFLKNCEAEREEKIAEYFSKYLELYKLSKAKNDFKTAKEILDSSAKIEGLYNQTLSINKNGDDDGHQIIIVNF